ncbi:MAG: PD-(D/E)XK nuclease family protein, partial [Gemmatimonadaceae bacterium]
DTPEAVFDAERKESLPDEGSGVPALLADFPRSAKAGIALHGVFEHADFADSEALSGVASAQLQQTGFDAKLWTAPVVDCVTEVLDTELTTPLSAFRLRDIPVDRRLDELAFALPVCGGLDAGDERVGASDLARAFRDHPGGTVPDEYADRLATIPFPAFRGFLSGVMDLVTEHDGRWYLVDYKSNHLGALRADYGVDRLRAAMVESHYVLQYHLYLVALDRWLALRVPGYSWDTHMGGVFYVFLRGMSREKGSHTGVYFDLPPRERIEAMSQAIYGESGVVV